MKREIFRCDNRMVHDAYGVGEKREIDPGFPCGVKEQSSRPLSVQKDGRYDYRERAGAVLKPDGGKASLSGPAPEPIMFGVPVSPRRGRKY